MTKITTTRELTDEALDGVSGGRYEVQIDTTKTAMKVPSVPISVPASVPRAPLPLPPKV